MKNEELLQKCASCQTSSQEILQWNSWPSLVADRWTWIFYRHHQSSDISLIWSWELIILQLSSPPLQRSLAKVIVTLLQFRGHYGTENLSSQFGFLYTNSSILGTKHTTTTLLGTGYLFDHLTMSVNGFISS